MQHAIGETCVPTHPQRVIVLDTNPLDAILALGVKPIAAPEFDFLSLPPEQIQNIQVISVEPYPNLEQITLLRPDLILGNQWNEAIYPQLAQIAPTVIAASIDAAWKQDLRLYAQALNRTQVAETLIKRYEERIQAFQQQMGNRLEQTEVSLVSTISYGAGRPARIYLENSFMGAVVAETGLPRPSVQTALTAILTRDAWGIDISLERLDLIDADVIFAINTDPQDQELKSTLLELQQHPLWSQLNVVQRGHVYPVDYYIWVAQRNIGGANRILDDLFKYLVEQHSTPPTL